MVEELLRRMHLVHVLPAPARIRLEESGEAHIVENLLPVQRIDQVAHGLVGRALGMLVVRQDHGRRNGHAQAVSQSVVEKFVVGGPPERVVDDDGAVEFRVLQVRAIKRDVLRDAIDDDAVAAGLGHLYSAKFDELRGDALDLHAVDLFHQSRRKSIFHAEHDADLVHNNLFSVILSEVAASRGEAATQSKDPYPYSEGRGPSTPPADSRANRLSSLRMTFTKNILLPSSATTASRASSCLPTHPASAGFPWHSKWLKT